MFYKNVIYVLPIWFYGIESLYSGVQLYDIYLYQCYNLLYTGMPICWFSTFDYQHSKAAFLSNPGHYSIGIKDQCFNPYIFWYYYISAIWHGAVLLYLTFFTLDESAGEEY